MFRKLNFIPLFIDGATKILIEVLTKLELLWLKIQYLRWNDTFDYIFIRFLSLIDERSHFSVDRTTLQRVSLEIKSISKLLEDFK